jgi:hypothetical protein
MSDVLVVITSQFIDGDGKHKGRQEFSMRADSDIFMYGDNDLVVSTIQKMIDQTMKGWEGKYQHVTHELLFRDQIELQGDFNKMYHESTGVSESN